MTARDDSAMTAGPWAVLRRVPEVVQLEQVHAVVVADCWRVVAVKGVKDADGVGLVHEPGDLCVGGPAEGGCFVGGGEVKTLADHRADRKAWLTEMLGLPAIDSANYRWEQVQPGDEDYLPHARRLLQTVADRLQWERALTEARRRARDALDAEVSATGRAA